MTTITQTESATPETHEFRLKTPERLGGIAIIFLVPALVIVVWSLEYIYLTSPAAPHDAADRVTVGVILFVLSLIFSWIYSLHARATGWFRVAFRVSRTHIERILPSGERTAHEWSKLRYISPKNSLFYFDSGTEMTLAYGPKPFGELSKQDRKTLETMCGKESLVARALGEYQSAVRKTNVFSGIAAVVWASLVLAFFVYSNRVLHSSEFGTTPRSINEFLWAMFVIIIAFPTGGMLLGLWLTLRLRTIERKYGPPKNYLRRRSTL